MNTTTTVTVVELARARAEAEYAGLEAHTWADITPARYVDRATDTLTHPTLDGVTYDVTRPLVDVDGCAWACCGWAQDGDPLMNTTNGWSAGAPVPLSVVCRCFGPLHPSA